MVRYWITGILISAVTFLTLVMCDGTHKTTDSNEGEGAIHEIADSLPAINIEYGLLIDSFAVETATIRRNELLSNILNNESISAATIDKISKMDSIFDVRKMRSGHVYKLLKSRDSISALEYFIYEHTLTDYVLIQFKDSLSMTVGTKPVAIVKKLASGEIESNLWDAMVKNGINPMMSIELSEIYAWSIDFFGLQKGDQFHVIYDEKYLSDTVSAGIEKIYAALFNHQNKDFYAVYFVQDETESYFDEEGNSLRREFLKAPLKYSRISSKFSKARFHPVLKIYRPHSGIDYAAPEGTPVYSVGDGIVIKKGFQANGAGKFIKIKHNSVYTTQYAHLSRFEKGIKQGSHIKQGELIGYVGSTGYSTGPHLDFRFFKNGEPVDPLKVDAPPVEPIKKINKEEYERIKNEFVRQLDEQRVKYINSKETTIKAN